MSRPSRPPVLDRLAGGWPYGRKWRVGARWVFADAGGHLGEAELVRETIMTADKPYPHTRVCWDWGGTRFCDEAVLVAALRRRRAEKERERG